MPVRARLPRFLSVLTLLLLAGWMAALPAEAQDGEVVDEIVAIVGNDIILRSDVDGLVYGYIQQGRTTYSPELWREALEQLIDQHVLTILAERDTTIEVSDDEVDQALDQRIQQLTAQVGSQAQLEELYGKSVVQIRAELREEFRDRLLAEQYQNRKLQQIKITPSEVRAWFRQIPPDSLPTVPATIRASHVVRYPEPSPEARAEALEIITTIRDSIVTGGASLEEMAELFSDDAGSAQNGGRLQDFKLDDLVPEFAAVASRLPIGEISQVFETPFGYHILRVNSRRGDVVDFNHILIQIDRTKFDATGTIQFLSVLRDSVLHHNVPFETIARRHSQEQLSAQRGGRVVDPRTLERDLVLDALGPSWRSTIDTLEIGEISHPAEVELLDGDRAFHIVKLTRRVPEHTLSLETDYARIEQYALQEKRAVEMRKWLDQLRKEVYIEVRGKAAALNVARN